MKQLLAFAFFLAAGSAIAQQSGIYEYIKHPQPGDSVCAKDLQKAEKEIAAGQLHLVEFLDPMQPSPRSLVEFRQLSEEVKMPVIYYSGSSFMFAGQRRGCYAYRMDAEITERFGKGFKDSLHIVAERRYIQNHLSDTLVADACDEYARPQDIPVFDHQHFYVSVPREFTRALSPYSVYEPNMVLEFVVDKKGNITGTQFSTEDPIRNYPPAEEARLFRLAEEALLKTGKWFPGMLGGYPVASKTFVAVYFQPGRK